MSRRASVFAREQKENPGLKKSKPKVRFPDELVFLDDIKEDDLPAVEHMLRRASVTIDINAITHSGMTPLHQAVVDGNYGVVKILLNNGSNVNLKDEDSWTPLHAACANGEAEIAQLLLDFGADKDILNDDDERPLDLVDATDFPMIKVMLDKNGNNNNYDSHDELEEEDEEEEEEEDEVREAKDDVEDEEDDEEDEEESSMKFSKFRQLKLID